MYESSIDLIERMFDLYLLYSTPRPSARLPGRLHHSHFILSLPESPAVHWQQYDGLEQNPPHLHCPTQLSSTLFGYYIPYTQSSNPFGEFIERFAFPSTRRLTGDDIGVVSDLTEVMAPLCERYSL
ncbi:hypothetical protein EX30DRAFT_131495 [Ascodesmis nigricans]|uniref:Uncharacterized protein n=1 Tax=Ascodesmis nigricans TaxID=341454 RepID=A0A4S2MNS1_9PEZI|nr:hypothetical protein EX30DRAFT_131495 [Ascodesmis nigricans]